MAPKRAAAKSASASVAKKAKIDAKVDSEPKRDAMFQPVLDGIMEAVDMSESCRLLFLAMIPGALRAASDERQPAQNEAVQMIGEALGGVIARLQQELDVQNYNMIEAEMAHDEMLAKLEQLERCVVEAVALENTRHEELIEAEGEVAKAKAALLEKQSVQRSRNVELDAAEGHKVTITDAFENNFKAIRDGGDDTRATQNHYAEMLPAVGLLDLEESLAAALECYVKGKGHRGDFDNVVLEQVEKAFSDKLDALITLLEGGIVARQERADAVQAATNALEEVVKVNTERKHHHAVAEQDLQTARNEVSAAKKELMSYEPRRRHMIKARDAQVDRLEHFKTYTIEAFESLRDRVSKPAVLEVASTNETAMVDFVAEAAFGQPTEVDAGAEAAPGQPAEGDAVAEAALGQPAETAMANADGAVEEIGVLDAVVLPVAAPESEADERMEVVHSKTDIMMQESVSAFAVAEGGA